MSSHVLTVRELTAAEVRAWRPAWDGVPDDRLPVVRQLVCSCGEEFPPSERPGLAIYGPGYVHRLAAELDE